jgi:hypothetical protein
MLYPLQGALSAYRSRMIAERRRRLLERLAFAVLFALAILLYVAGTVVLAIAVPL